MEKGSSPWARVYRVESLSSREFVREGINERMLGKVQGRDEACPGTEECRIKERSKLTGGHWKGNRSLKNRRAV